MEFNHISVELPQKSKFAIKIWFTKSIRYCVTQVHSFAFGNIFYLDIHWHWHELTVKDP